MLNSNLRYSTLKLSIFFLLLFPALLFAGEGNTLFGTVLDKETNEPVPFSYIHLEEIHRTTVATAEGKFELSNIPKGTYTLTVHRIGYKTQTQIIELGFGNSTELKLTIELSPSLLSSQAIEVTGDTPVSGSNLEHASKKLLGSDLRRDLGATLSETLSNVPGIDQRTNGSAPGRPVIRGLGDERVTILQDGIASGDVSAQSGDHAVTIDPVAAQEVEIARGPAALAYGANAIGGVINVVRNQIQTSMPGKTTGSLTVTGESVNNGLSGAFNLTTPYRSLVLNLDINGRFASDTDTPDGAIPNSYFNTANNSVGLSWIQPKGYIGASFGSYISSYGIPPDPAGHPDGVDIDLNKFQYVLKGEYIFDGAFFKTFDADYSLNNYNHKEFENAEVIGTEFGLVTQDFNAKATHSNFGILSTGRFGVDGTFQDYAVTGASTPNSTSASAGLFVIEEADINALHLEAGLRYDWVRNAPDNNDSDSRIGNIRSRTFQALSGSVSAIYGFSNGISVGSTILQSFRAPSMEELFSEGPHLASYSFEIGNPDLEPERGLAKEIFVRYNGKATLFELALYHNGFSNYLYAKNTGERNNRYPDLNNYQFVGTEAELYGFELSGERELLKSIVLDASLSYTIGVRDSLTANNDIEKVELPMIPPMRFNSSITYLYEGLKLGARYRFSSKQDRVGAFETETPSYHLVDTFIQYQLNSQKLLHTFSFTIGNLFNERYFNHLSRIKDLHPEAGRNIRFLYRVYF